MPRAEKSSAGRIIDFFQSQPLDTAVLVLGLCQDKVRERKAKSESAKVRATAGKGPAAPTPAPARKAAVRKQKAAKRKAPAMTYADSPAAASTSVR